MTRRFTFAFKYKLIVLIASMILALLGGSFFVVQRNIEIQFTQSIPMAEKINTLQCQIQNLRRTRDLLLPRLLSGQIDMKEFLVHA